ncbi:MAG: glycosyltransferase [Fluviicola sp.]|nr:glycosyltransferase [Fluviicola sp.]
MPLLINLEENYTYQLSVIIVNYNVEYFLDQCLDSVKKAMKNSSVEVIIVDNNSIDGSLQMLNDKYSNFHLIANKDNVGFSKANNQGIEIAKGKYVLLLNPDTIVEESTFEKVIDFMEKNDDAGGLGVRMIDGKGNFLPESKRGLPTPKVAFYKIFGLSKLFPKSKKIGQYHLGHLSEFETNEVDILSGAFMLMRKKALDKVGLLDEDFFMYGEDIDLSYRIQKGGYKNYYFAGTKIIHYKGESTKKSSVNYVIVFYNAMVIFAKKHFTGKNAKLFSFLINAAIYLRAFIAVCVQFVKAMTLPVIDAAYIIVGLYALTNYWRMRSIDFPEELIAYSIPIYGLIWLASNYFNGGYDKPYKLSKLVKGVFWGTVLILIVYAVLPKSWQFSRLFIFIGAGWVLSYYLISRLFLHLTVGKKFSLKFEDQKHFGIVSNTQEFERIKSFLLQTNGKIGSITQLSSDSMRIDEQKLDEIVFSSADLSYEFIIDTIEKLKSNNLDFKIAPSSAEYLIGSNSIDTAGDLYILNLNNLVSRENRRKKRLFDVIFSLLFLLSSPILLFLLKSKGIFLRNSWRILIGKMSFIGFSEESSKKDVRLPKIKAGVLSPTDGIGINTVEIQEKMNLLYARNYSMRKDFGILLKAWRKLDS